MVALHKPRLLTGDTPTGRLHLGHWIGTLQSRVALQDTHSSYILVADLHALTTYPENAHCLKDKIFEMVLDYLAAGIDPQKTAIFIQSEIPAISELTYLLSMLLPYSRVLRNPTLKEEIQFKNLGDHYSFGFLLYPVGQVADILAFRPERVPVGADQIPHLEMTKEVARRFNQMYCGVDPHAPDEKSIELGGLFSILPQEPSIAQRLVGIGPPNASGTLPKMSKSLNNAIFLSDTPEIIKKKVMGMYTDPNRIRVTDCGAIKNNPLWDLHDAFNSDSQWVAKAKALYQTGQISDVECKKKLIDVLVTFTEPMREQRAQYANHPQAVWSMIKEGTAKANQVAQETLMQVKSKMHLNYFR